MDERHHDDLETNQEPSTPSPASTPTTSDGLRALALRLLWPRHSFEPRPAGEPDLLVAQLPPALPVAVPLPPASRVIGSLAGQTSATIVLDCDQGAEAVLDFYREHLGAQGWVVPGMRGPMHGGFVMETAGPQAYIQFCQGNHGLNVAIHEVSGHPSDVRLQLDTYDDPRHSPCAPPDPRHAMRDRMWEIMPPLPPPPGAAQRPEGGSGSQDVLSITARLTTDLDLAAVSAHYARLLERAKWTRDEEGSSGPAGWSAWSLADEEGKPWHGLFLALRQPRVPNEYFLLVRIALDEGATGTMSGSRVVSRFQDGWTSSSMVIGEPTPPR